MSQPETMLSFVLLTPSCPPFCPINTFHLAQLLRACLFFPDVTTMMQKTLNKANSVFKCTRLFEFCFLTFSLLAIFINLERAKAKIQTTEVKKMKAYDHHPHRRQKQITSIKCDKTQRLPAHLRSAPEYFQKYRFLDHNTDLLHLNFLGAG